MTLNEKIIAIYPELEGLCTPFSNSAYKIQDDSDGRGPYIKEWNYYKPQPTEEQLSGVN